MNTLSYNVKLCTSVTSIELNIELKAKNAV